MLEYARQTGQIGYLFNLDQSKAFDMVNHDLMFKILEKFGIPQNFLKYIKSFYGNCKSMIQNYGYFSEEIEIKRGVRQGCPLSFFLYVIVAETMAISIREDKQIKGYPCPPPALPDTQVKISMYADDTISP